MRNKSVCIVGLGYIGLPTAALLACNNFQVFGVDLNPDIVKMVNSGQPHFSEKKLDEYVEQAVNEFGLVASTVPHPADVFIICVPTPFHENDGFPAPNINYVLQATKEIAKFIKDGDVIILESTSPVGTTQKVRETLISQNVDVSKVYFAYCPERVMPGNIVLELVQNDRIVGGLNDESANIAGDFYRSFVTGTVIETDAETAEMCKLVENSFRDINIAFANELSIICNHVNIDVRNLIELANRHPRVNILEPGIGVGGHCIAVDPWFIISEHPDESRLIRTARLVNDTKTDWVVKQVLNEFSNFKPNHSGKLKITCLGLAFKPDVDDLRGSPAIRIAQALKQFDVELNCVEPNIEHHEDFKIVSFNDALKSDIIIALVKHTEFLTSENNRLLKEANVLDFCGVLTSSLARH